MFKKWWFYVIIAVVVILIAVPLITITNLNNSVYDLSYEYVKLDDPLTEIAKKHIYYEAETKTLEVELNQDFINSMLKDQLATMDLGLPEKFTIQEAAFKTADQRLYINAKYGSISLPISAKINITPDETGLNISADSFNLGKKKAPGFVVKRIPVDQLKYSIKYADLGVPQLFTVKEIKYGTGNLNAFIELDINAIKNLAKDYRNEIETAINGIKASSSPAIATFIDRALAEGLLSDANVDKYVEQVLNNEELVNSAILFALAPDLDKYSKGLETYQKAIVDWAAPVQTLKFDGTLEETVDSILYNEDLQDMLAWFIPAATLTEYVDTADTYYTAYKTAQGSMNALGAALSSGDIEKAVKLLVADKELYGAVTMVLPTEDVDYYLGTISQYYNLYADVTKKLTDVLDSIPAKDIDKYVNDAVEFVYKIDDGQQYLLDLISGIDTSYVQSFINYLDQDDGIIKQQLTADPVLYDSFMYYVDNLDGLKQYLIDSIKSAEIGIAKEAADIINDINDDLQNVLKLLKAKKYEEAGNAMGKISFDKADKFIKEQSERIKEIKGS